VRHERIMPDGRKRNSVRFSIIDEEWPQVRQALESKLSDIARRTKPLWGRACSLPQGFGVAAIDATRHPTGTNPAAPHTNIR